MVLENEAGKPSWAAKKSIVGPAFDAATDDPRVQVRLQTKRCLILPGQPPPSGASFEKLPPVWSSPWAFNQPSEKCADRVQFHFGGGM